MNYSFVLDPAQTESIFKEWRWRVCQEGEIRMKTWTRAGVRWLFRKQVEEAAQRAVHGFGSSLKKVERTKMSKALLQFLPIFVEGGDLFERNIKKSSGRILMPRMRKTVWGSKHNWESSQRRLWSSCESFTCKATWVRALKIRAII